MNIDDMIDLLDDMIDEAFRMPLTGGKCLIDGIKARELIDEIRMNMPQEIKQAKAIVADRSEIIAGARAESEGIIRKAEERAKMILNKDELVVQAQAKANEILNSAQQKSREIRQAANEFSDEILKALEETLVKNINEVKQTRNALRSKKFGGNQTKDQAKM